MTEVMWVRLWKPPPHRYIEFLAQSKVICTSVGQVLPEYRLCIQVGTLVALSSSQSKHARFLTHQRFDASMRARFSTGHFFIEDGQNGGRLCNGVSLVSTPIHDASSALLWNTPSLSCLLETTSTLCHASQPPSLQPYAPFSCLHYLPVRGKESAVGS